jgi:hypothetical protein
LATEQKVVSKMSAKISSKHIDVLSVIRGYKKKEN